MTLEGCKLVYTIVRFLAVKFNSGYSCLGGLRSLPPQTAQSPSGKQRRMGALVNCAHMA
jgi:hypothetical protein